MRDEAGSTGRRGREGEIGPRTAARTGSAGFPAFLPHGVVRAESPRPAQAESERLRGGMPAIAMKDSTLAGLVMPVSGR
ncbi:hypothetical protein GCM10026982_01750 [Nocardiopsis aegyptia]